MHVLYIPSWYPRTETDVSGSFFREQALALAEAGAKVGVVALGLRSLRRVDDLCLVFSGVSVADDHGIPTYRKSLGNWTPRFWAPTLFRIQLALERVVAAYIAEHGKPDVVHLHAALPVGPAVMDYFSKRNIPVVLSEHSSAYARRVYSNPTLRLARSVALRASARFAVSSALARTLDVELGLGIGCRFEVLPNSVSADFLDAPISTPVPGRFRFLHVSLLDKVKNLPLLLQAFAAQFQSNLAVTLTIIGDSPERVSLEQLARDLAVERQVSFLGGLSRTEVQTALFHSDAFVLTSDHETFGVVVIEALAMGVPVIATRSGGPEDILTDELGVLVPVGNVAALGAAMRSFVTGEAIWDRPLIRASCRERYAAQHLARRWLAIYQSILTRNSSVS